MRLHFKDDLYDAQLLRAVGHPTYQGSEQSEAFRKAAVVRPVVDSATAGTL